jgi:hypothetical protein
MLDVVEANIGALNPQHDDFNENAVAELDFQVKAYEKMGMTAPDALRRATWLLFRFDPTKPAAKAEPEPEKKEDKPAKPPVAEKKTDFKKSVETAKRQPPDGSGVGVSNDQTKLNPKTMTEEEMDALPESKRRELRGDFAV